MFVQTLTVPVNSILWQYLLKDGALAWTGMEGAKDIDLSFILSQLYLYYCSLGTNY